MLKQAQFVQSTNSYFLHRWFFNACRNRLGVDWNSGHVRINIRREYLVEDSIQAVMSLSRKDLRRIWRFEFIGER